VVELNEQAVPRIRAKRCEVSFLPKPTEIIQPNHLLCSNPGLR